MRHPNAGPRIAKRALGMLTVAALAAFATAESASAQLGATSAHPGEDMMSLNVYGGGFFFGSSFSDGTRFDDSGTVGANATFWAHPNVGVRANILWFRPDVSPGSAESELAGQDPDMLHYSGDLVLRMPMPAGQNVSWYPYLLGGAGGKTYDFETLGTGTDFAGNVGLGLEVRFGQTGRWGIHTEVRDFISEFDRVGLTETLHDVIWTGGVSFNF